MLSFLTKNILYYQYLHCRDLLSLFYDIHGRFHSIKTLLFRGVATVDIDLSQVDINQCDLDGSSSFTYKIFAGTHHCHNATSRVSKF